VFLLFIVFLILCIARLFYIQFFRSKHLLGIAKKQHNLFVELEPRRGTIFDSNLKPQAVNVSADSVFASPDEISDKDKETIIKELTRILGKKSDYLRDRLYRDKSFIWLSRKITPDQSDEIKSLDLKGIGMVKESKRCYPNGYLTSQVIGFAGLDNTGLEGIEFDYNGHLKGENGFALFLRDARQKKLEIWESMIFPQDGYNVVLTIDEVIQYIAERELDKAFKKYNAKGASIIVMDPYTGEILAMANRPTFDLNNYNRSSREKMRNRAICDLFEPGSVFKIITLASALEEKKVVEEDKFFCENGEYRVASHTLHDHRPHGWLTFREVIEKSSNIGTVKVAQLLGNELLYKYIRLFGFGEKLGIDLPGEISGIIRPPSRWSKISITAIPIGQEVGVTLLQLATAVSVIANGGELMRPFVVKEIRDKHGEVIKSFSPSVIRRVISQETAMRARDVLSGVVTQGTGRRAKIKGISAAGKTGTAQKLDPNGAYSHSKFIASFIGFAPVDDPVVSIVVMVDEPRPYYYGGVVAAPVFKNVANDAIKYLKTKNVLKEAVASNESE